MESRGSSEGGGEDTVGELNRVLPIIGLEIRILMAKQTLGTEVGSSAEKVYPRLGYTQVCNLMKRS